MLVEHLLHRSMIGNGERQQDFLVIGIREYLFKNAFQTAEKMHELRVRSPRNLYAVNKEGSVFFGEIEHVNVADPLGISEYPYIEEVWGQ